MHTTRRAISHLLASAVMIAAAGATIVATPQVAAAATVSGDGTTAATAGASCWGIKQQVPSSPSGIYWLLTSQLEAPQQFSCDMTTDGGGWVLVARGREGWTFGSTGQGSPQLVRNAITGTAAFVPAALSSTLIDKVLGGQSVAALPDGIRVRRALSADGSSWQELRLNVASQQRWSWGFGGGIILSSTKIDGSTYQGGNTRDTSVLWGGPSTNQLAGKQGTQRMWTYPWSSHAWNAGFAYGTGVNGSNSSSTYLWQSGNEGSPVAFAQVWLRPQIANSALPSTPIPTAGFAANPVPAELKTHAEVNPWGVTGIDTTNDQSESASSKVNVMVVKPFADKVYVAGRFTTVRNAAGTQSVTQKFLAAFDRTTGNWIPSFAPVLDGRVFAVDFTADGKMIIGGDFTNVNGAPNTVGLAALDPNTGAVLPSWHATLTRSDWTSTRPIVRSLTVKDGWIYAGGRFTTVTGGTWKQFTVSGLTKLSAVDGTPAGGFSAILPASPVSLATSAAGDRLYLAGAFANISGDTNMGYFGILSTATGQSVPGMGPWLPSTPNAKYQQAVTEVGGNLVIGGSEHDLQMYDHNRSTMLQSHITRQGGDFQAVAVLDGKIYGSCHCFNWDYQHANLYSAPANYEKVEPMNDIGRFDAGTLDHEAIWWPGGLRGPTGDGIWSLNPDVDHCLWFGGDLDQVGGTGTIADWAAGFGRFCQDDATPPTTPQNVKASTSGTTATLTWSAATDASGAPQYWVYRNDRVVGVTYGTTFVDTGLTSNARYAVRAVDAKGNESATLAPITAIPDNPALGTPIPQGSTWRYADTGADRGTAWSATAFDDSAWAQGPAMLGWGKSPVTAIGPTHPVTTYFRRSFTVANSASVRTLHLGARVDDGAIVYLNGREVARIQMPAGAVKASTLASSYTSGALESTFRPFTIPGSLLLPGTNVVAVEVHQADAANADAIFDLQLDAFGAGPDAVVPSAPTLHASPAPSSVSLGWTAATDDGVVAGYLVHRDGAVVAYVPAPDTSWVDAPVASGPHTYVVDAVDANGNTSPSSPVTVTTP